jgi:LmbE family N-acetylglucosaminyl deacetylase
MIDFQISRPADRALSVLCLGAHCDDIEIGCGAALLHLLSDERPVNVKWVVLSSTPERQRETRESASRFLRNAAQSSISFGDFPNSFFPYCGDRIKQYLLEQRETFAPDLVFTHFGRDAHQDHRIVAELTWNLYRNHVVLEYEIPKYDADLVSPNVFFSVSREVCDQKIDILLTCYESQRNKQWFDEETFRALLRLRGVECASDTAYAEGFHARKLVVAGNGRA